MAAAERDSGQVLNAPREYVAPTKLGVTDLLREMLAAIQADDSDRYWKAFEMLIAMHNALLKQKK